VFLAASESAGQCLASMAAGPGAGVSTTPFGAGCFQAERLAGEGAWSWGVGSGEEEEEAEAGGSMAARRGGLGFRGGGGLRRRRRRRW
jgi:hypothetical protein